MTTARYVSRNICRRSEKREERRSRERERERETHTYRERERGEETQDDVVAVFYFIFATVGSVSAESSDERGKGREKKKMLSNKLATEKWPSYFSETCDRFYRWWAPRAKTVPSRFDNESLVLTRRHASYICHQHCRAVLLSVYRHRYLHQRWKFDLLTDVSLT